MNGDWSYRLREHRGTLLALFAFAAMFAIYIANHPVGLNANVATTAANKGVLLAAEPLYPVETAKTLRIRNGRTTITDGPFTETKEQLAGFYLVDAPSHEEALKIAAKIPPAREGSIEVRPVRELEP